MAPWMGAGRTLFASLIVSLVLFGWTAIGPASAQEAANSGTWRVASLRAGDLDAAGLPRLLDPEDAVLYARIFALQEEGRWGEADRLIGRIDDELLIGHVLAQRYLHAKYRTSYDELVAWLERYGDHPNGHRLYRLAETRRPASGAAPPEPHAGSFGLEVEDTSPPIAAFDEERLTAGQKKVEKLLRKIRASISDGDPVSAHAVLKSSEFKRLATPETFDRAAQSVAFSYYLKGKAKTALELAAKAATRSGAVVPQAYWTAGLAAYRLGRYEAAGKHFAALARNGTASGRQRAAGAYWAARAAREVGNPSEVLRFLNEAAGHPTAFYGLVAREALGQPVALTWNEPDLSPRERDKLVGYPEVRRVLALVQVGQRWLAEQEFSGLDAQRDPGRALLVLGLATRLGLPATELRLAYELADHWNARFQASLYPVPLYRPRDGFVIDRALLFAFMRQESAFNPFARSSAGATGLMQLMPATAAYISGDKALADKKSTALFDPELNLALGQRYIADLMDEAAIGDNLLFLAAAYNAGPGNLRKWLKGPAATDDPLLLLESMPSAETRHFVQQVMANFWLYRARLGQDSPSLRAAAEGRWPAYEGLDARQVAANARD